MDAGQWMRVLDTVGGLVQMSGRFRRDAGDAGQGLRDGAAGPLGQLETRLAGIVVAALKEAFDRDRARMDMERSQIEAEHRRAHVALEAELRRQSIERSLGQLRLIAIIAAAVWMLSAALGLWLPNIRGTVPLALMAGGWALAIGALGCALFAWHRVAGWPLLPQGAGENPAAGAGPFAGDARGSGDIHPPAERMAVAALALLLGSVALTGAALLSAL